MKLVNQLFTMFVGGWSPEARSAMSPSMAKRTPMAGGFLWMASILVGAVWGIAAGNPMNGILIGTAAGGAIAALVWLLDRAQKR